MASLTLFEQSRLRTDPGELAVIAELNTSELTRLVTWQNVEGGAYAYAQEDELPDAQFRLLDEAQDDSLGQVRTQAEILKVFGKDIKTDSSKIDLYGPKAHRRQVEMATRAIRMRFEDTFINGNAAGSNQREFDGLATRLNIGSSQAINNGGSVGTGTGLSLAAVDELLDAVDAPASDKVLVVPKSIRRRFWAAARDSSIGGNINFRPDEFGKQVAYYGESRIVATDVNNNREDVQGFTETGSTASIYAVAFGDGMVSGLQGKANGQYGLSVYDVGEMHVTPTFLTRIKWHISIVIENTRAAARLYNIENSAIIA